MTIHLVRVRTIIGKEWADVFRNRMVLYTTLLLPILFIVISLGVLIGMRTAPEGELNEMPPAVFDNPMFAGFDTPELVQGLMVNQFLLFFLIIPLALPVAFAAYSIVGEKQQRSLEPLLATPISVAELLLGKNLAAALPAIGATWLSFLIFAVAARFSVVSDRVYGVIIHPMWLVAIFLLSPFLTVFAVNVGMIISSRVSDPRAAEQLGMLVMLPILALFFAQFTGLVFLSAATMALGIVVMAAANVVMLYLAVRLFQRETILTRWR